MIRLAGCSGGNLTQVRGTVMTLPGQSGSATGLILLIDSLEVETAVRPDAASRQALLPYEGREVTVEGRFSERETVLPSIVDKSGRQASGMRLLAHVDPGATVQLDVGKARFLEPCK